MPYIGKKPADIIATAVDTTTGTFSGAITSSAGATISTADNTAQLILQSTDTDASSGPQLTLKRDSSSPADDDFVGRVKFIGENDADQEVVYVDLISRIKDASDGTEDSEFRLATIRGGTETTDFKITSSGLNSVPEIVFNDDSTDLNFRVESNGQANMLFVDGGNDIVSIAGGGSHTVGSFANTLQIEGTTGSTSSMSITRNTAGTSPPYLQFGKTRGTSVGSSTIVQSGDTLGIITFCGADGTNRDTNGAMIQVDVDGTPGENDMPGRMIFKTTADGASSPSERARIQADGHFLIGTTTDGTTAVGTVIRDAGEVLITRDSNPPLLLNRNTSSGDVIEIRHDNTRIGSIQERFGGLLVGSSNTNLLFNSGSGEIAPSVDSGGVSDDVLDLGANNRRFDDIFATNGTIQTSDRNEKQDIEELTDAEKRVAVVAKGLMRKFRWKSRVAEKGDKARTHFGIIAQDLQDAFTAEGLDASNYAMFISSTWWQKEVTVDAVEAKEDVYEEVIDSNGNKTNNIVSHAVEAKDAYTYIDAKQEATEGYTEKTRLGVRYSELLAFIISAI